MNPPPLTLESLAEALVASGNVTADDAAPYITSITGSLNAAAASLALVDPTGITVRSLMERQTDDELANLVAGIINDIAQALQGLVAQLGSIELLAGLLAGLDVALNQVRLRALEQCKQCLIQNPGPPRSRHPAQGGLELGCSTVSIGIPCTNPSILTEL